MAFCPLTWLLHPIVSLSLSSGHCTPCRSSTRPTIAVLSRTCVDPRNSASTYKSAKSSHAYPYPNVSPCPPPHGWVTCDRFQRYHLPAWAHTQQGPTLSELSTEPAGHKGNGQDAPARDTVAPAAEAQAGRGQIGKFALGAATDADKDTSIPAVLFPPPPPTRAAEGNTEAHEAGATPAPRAVLPASTPAESAESAIAQVDLDSAAKPGSRPSGLRQPLVGVGAGARAFGEARRRWGVRKDAVKVAVAASQGVGVTGPHGRWGKRVQEEVRRLIVSIVVVCICVRKPIRPRLRGEAPAKFCKRIVAIFKEEPGVCVWWYPFGFPTFSASAACRFAPRSTQDHPPPQ